MAKNDDRDWAELTLDEKLTELGFTRDADEAAGDPGVDERRMHAALDQLLDAGGVLAEIEALVKPTAEGVVGADVPGEMVETFRLIYGLVTAEDTDA